MKIKPLEHQYKVNTMKNIYKYKNRLKFDPFGVFFDIFFT